jgi:hypothetical protein
MPLPRRDFRATGPKEGQRFPDVRLSDQTGALVDLHVHRAGRSALVMLYRRAEIPRHLSRRLSKGCPTDRWLARDVNVGPGGSVEPP